MSELCAHIDRETEKVGVIDELPAEPHCLPPRIQSRLGQFSGVLIPGHGGEIVQLLQQAAYGTAKNLQRHFRMCTPRYLFSHTERWGCRPFQRTGLREAIK